MSTSRSATEPPQPTPAERLTRRLALLLDAGPHRWVCTFWRIACFGFALGALTTAPLIAITLHAILRHPR
jgi:hypothetical protein